jgi:tetratricopeptide (TPR) repeat protein
VESAVRSIQARFDSIKADPTKLREASQELRRVAGNQAPPPELSTLVSEIDYHLARVTEVLEARPKNVEEMTELYVQTGVVPRRLRWRQSSPENDVRLASSSGDEKESTQLYRESLNQARQTLLTLPLDSVARTKHVYLDFIHQDSALTSVALQQLRQIYRNNPAMLMRLGVFAADSGETEVAVEMWQSALLQEPAYTWHAIELTENRNDIQFTEVVPRQAKNFRAAATYLLAKGIQNDAFLIDALEGIECDSSSLLVERAKCEQLAGDIEFRLGRFDDAFASYRSAIKRTPADVDLRLKLIHRLRDQGLIRESRTLAQEAKQLFPDDGRFQAAIEELAIIDLQAVESDKN